MSQTDVFSNGEFEMAIAAAAFAIASLEQEGLMNQKKSAKGSGISQTTTESRREDDKIKQADSSRPFERPSHKESKEDGKVAGDNFAKKAGEVDQRMLEDSAVTRKNTDRIMGAIPTMKKTTTFTDKYLNEMSSKGFESGKQMKNPKAPSSQKPTTLISSKKNWDEKSADAWENEEMLKIRNRYDKMNASILEWENEKKTKAKYWMEQQEREHEQSRTRASQEYHTEISWIDKFAGGSRALVDEKKRNSESKARKKARAMRSTGKIPRSCFCF